MNTTRLLKMFAVVWLACSCCAAAFAQGKPHKAIFVYGGWPGHAPERYRDLLVPWLQSEGFDVTVTDSLDIYTNKEAMAQTDLIVQIRTMDKTITIAQLQGLMKAVENGAGLAGWHGGLADAFRDQPRYEYMVGGSWGEHPGNDGIPYRVNITDHNDPITKGLADFDVVSEQYYMLVDPNNKVLATTTFNGEHDPWVKGAVMPVAWEKMYGKGRVFYTSLGHQPEVFNVPEAFTLLKRGILWASRSKYDPTPNLVTPKYPSK